MINNGSYDGCGFSTVALSKTNFHCGNIGINNVTLTISDVSNNSSNCTATVTVEDNIAPIASCENMTIQLDATGQGSLTPDLISSGSSDACGISTMALDKYNYDCSNVGSNTVTLTITDLNGNSGTCTATVTVEDNIAPTASCQNVSVQLDANGQGTITADMINNGSADACSISSSTLDNTDFNCNNVGINNVNLTISDANGNSSICSATVTVQDNEAPTLVCHHPTITFNGEAAIPTQIDQIWNESASSDNCGNIVPVGLSISQITCDQIGSVVPVTLTAEDNNGNTSECIANVTVHGLPCGWHIDPNSINCDGATADYNPVSSSFSLTSEGCYNSNYYRPSDSHGFIQTELCGDGILVAQVTAVNGNGWAGISMRESNAADAPMIQLMMDGNGLSRREVRVAAGGMAFAHLYQSFEKNWLKLQRSGQHFTAYHSSDGQNWELVFETNISMANCIQMGLITMNGAPSGAVTGIFGSVQWNNGATAPLAMPQGAGVDIIDLEPEPQVSQMNVYPNPTFGQVTLSFSGLKGEGGQLRVFNLKGQLLQEVRLDLQTSNLPTLDMSDFDAGLYLLQLETDSGILLTKEIIKN